MGHNIFISYKYGDTSVKRLRRTPLYKFSKVRDYVDELQDQLYAEDQINKGELDGEDLSQFKDSTIKSNLRDKIYYSSVTIVLISPNMKERNMLEDNQWIPWEISYSLRETTRKDHTTRRNGILGVVLPDALGNYNYMLEQRTCCEMGCTIWHTEKLFEILKNNMFNKKEKDKDKQECIMGDNVYSGYCSYIQMIKWDDFINNINYWIEEVKRIRDNKDAYNIHVNV